MAASCCPGRGLRLASATTTITATAPPPIPMLQLSRRRPIGRPLLLIASASGKGFGGGDSDKSSSSSSSANKLKKKDEPLLRQALDPSRASPIDPREASRGRVDVATVKSWKGLDASKQRKGGAGADTSALGELELKSFAPDKEGTNASAGTSSPPPTMNLGSQPLYEALARRLSVLQASGALAEPAPSSTSKRSIQKRKLPRFEDWRWSETRYVQFLVDCLVVHSALETAVAEALGAAEGVFGRAAAAAAAAGGAGGGGGGGGGGGKGQAERLAAFAALSYLGASSGLCRSEEIAEDLEAIIKTSTTAAGSSSGSGESGSEGNASPSPSPSPHTGPKPSASAAATARYLLALGSCATREVVSEEEEEGRRAGGGSGGGGRAGTAFAAPRLQRRGELSSSLPASASAALRLLANCYSLQVTHLTTGMRVGASASEALGLLRRRGAGFYQTYPDDLDLAPKRAPLLLSLEKSGSGSIPSPPPARDNKRIVDPLRAFRSAVDGAGRVLSPPPPPLAAPAAPSSSSSSSSVPPPSPLLLGEVEGELVAAVRRAAALFEPLASSAEP